MNGPRRGVAVLLAYYAPPAALIAAQRMRGMIRHLPEMGWEPVVIAPERVHHHTDPSSLHALEGVRVVRTRNPEPSRWFGALAGQERLRGGEGHEEVRPAGDGGWRRTVRGWVRDWLYIPDAQALWIPWATKAAVEVLRSVEGPAVLYSTSVPFSAHFAAMRVARETGTHWVAEYRDPWTAAVTPTGPRSGLRGMIDQRLDHAVVRSADHLVVTTDATRQAFLDAFPELSPARIGVVRNGWEDVDGLDDMEPPPGTGPLSLVYAGSLFDPQWAVPLLDGVAAVVASQPGSVTLDVWGPRDAWLRAASARGGLPEFVRLHGMISGPEAASRVRSASASVIVLPDAWAYVPGKVYEYIGARRPILADFPVGSEAEWLVAAHGDLRSFTGRGARGVEAEVARLLSEHRAGRLKDPTTSLQAVEALSRRSQARALAAVFDSLTGRG